MTQGNETRSLIGQSTEFVSECVDELKKVHKPTRQEALQTTLVTIVMVAFVAIMLSIFDIIFNRLMLAVMS